MNEKRRKNRPTFALRILQRFTITGECVLFTYTQILTFFGSYFDKQPIASDFDVIKHAFFLLRVFRFVLQIFRSIFFFGAIYLTGEKSDATNY